MHFYIVLGKHPEGEAPFPSVMLLITIFDVSHPWLTIGIFMFLIRDCFSLNFNFIFVLSFL
jgi:hypothetical protein